MTVQILNIYVNICESCLHQRISHHLWMNKAKNWWGGSFNSDNRTQHWNTQDNSHLAIMNKIQKYKFPHETISESFSNGRWLRATMIWFSFLSTRKSNEIAFNVFHTNSLPEWCIWVLNDFFLLYLYLLFFSKTIFAPGWLKLGLSTPKLAMTKRKQESEVWPDEGELRWGEGGMGGVSRL